jgi:hypothetical protein
MTGAVVMSSPGSQKFMIPVPIPGIIRPLAALNLSLDGLSPNT